MKPEKIKIKIINPTISEPDSDRALFGLFDFIFEDSKVIIKDITDKNKDLANTNRHG